MVSVALVVKVCSSAVAMMAGTDLTVHSLLKKIAKTERIMTKVSSF